MSEARLEQRDGGGYAVRGDLTFETVPGLYHQGVRMFGAGGRLDVDLSGVGKTDSAGVALLVAWLRAGRAGGAEVRYQGVPGQMRDIVEVSGLQTILPLAS